MMIILINYYLKGICLVKLRRSGGKTFGPKKRTNEDDEKLYNNLIKLILKAKQ